MRWPAALLVALLVALLGCTNGLHGHEPLDTFEPLSPEEEHAVERMRAYIDASEELLQRMSMPPDQRAALAGAITDARAALARLIDQRAQGKGRDHALSALGVTAAGIVVDDASILGLANDPLLIPLGLTAIAVAVFTTRPATRDALTESWEQLGHSLDALGLAVQRTLPTVDLVPPLPAEPEERARRCLAVPRCPHLGQDPIHNACADTVPPNLHPGCDVYVNLYHYDALAEPRALWEIKTDDWSSYSEWLKEFTLERHVSMAEMQRARAVACGYDFVFAVSDEALARALRRSLVRVQVRHVPQCRRQIKK